MKRLLTAIALSSCLAVAGPGAGMAQDPHSAISSGLMNKVRSAVDGDADRLKTIFKDICQYPELGFMETRTAAIVAKELTAQGYEVKTGIGQTGVVGIFRNGTGPVVMYHADMDANAAEEATGLPYES